jgi:hypothetical protein
MRLNTLVKNYRNILNTNIVLYGANKTGKTTLLLDLLKIIKPHIPNVIAFAPTADSNNSLKGIVPNILINRKVELSTIKDAYKRQQDAASVYNNANDIGVLQSLFRRVAGSSQLKNEKDVIDLKTAMCVKLKAIVVDTIEKKKQENEIKEYSKKVLTSIYKKVISNASDVLLKMKITDTESQAIKFINFNPRMLMIFDDCASVFTKKFQNDPMIKDLFFMYRHSYITIIFTFQDDLGLESFLRKNATMSFFTTQQCADAYFARGSNHFSKDIKSSAHLTASIIFDAKQKSLPPYSKLLYIRGDPDPFRYYCAEVYDTFQFGSNALWELCDRVEKIRNAGNVISSTFGKY